MTRKEIQEARGAERFPKASQKGTKNNPKIESNWCQIDSKTAPKGSRGVPKSAPEGGPEGVWAGLGRFLGPRCLQEAFWGRSGAVLGRQVGPKLGPRWAPRGAKNRSKKASKIRSQREGILEAQAGRFGSILGPKMEPSWPPKRSQNRFRHGKAIFSKSIVFP